MFFGTFLHVLFRGAFLLGFVDIGIPATSIGGVSKAIDFDLAGAILKLQERFREIPTGQLQLFADHPSNRDLLLVQEVLPIEFFQDVLHLLIGLDVRYAPLPQLAQTALHALV